VDALLEEADINLLARHCPNLTQLFIRKPQDRATLRAIGKLTSLQHLSFIENGHGVLDRSSFLSLTTLTRLTYLCMSVEVTDQKDSRGNWTRIGAPLLRLESVMIPLIEMLSPLPLTPGQNNGRGHGKLQYINDYTIQEWYESYSERMDACNSVTRILMMDVNNHDWPAIRVSASLYECSICERLSKQLPSISANDRLLAIKPSGPPSLVPLRSGAEPASEAPEEGEELERGEGDSDDEEEHE
jgi:hypothetical protein